MIKSILSFKQIPFTVLNGVKVPSCYLMKPKSGEDSFISVNPDYEKNKFYLTIDNSNYEPIAQNCFVFDTYRKILSNGRMDVLKERDKGKGYGVAMHLNNVMGLLENNLDKIELNSLSEAVFFHSACKFEPDFKKSCDMERALNSIIVKDCSRYPDLQKIVDEAYKFLCESKNINVSNFKKEKVFEKANNIVKKYIDFVLSEKSDKEAYGFCVGFPMVLTKENILKNKDFFNKQFENKGFDYQIKDPQ